MSIKINFPPAPEPTPYMGLRPHWLWNRSYCSNQLQENLQKTKQKKYKPKYSNKSFN